MKKLLKKLKKLFKQKKGFTLIELLVVIGILGILAAALVATIDPFEQLNKAQDANTKNILVEYLNANVRFYANHSDYPWGPSVAVPCNGGNPPSSTLLCAGGAGGGAGCTVNNCLTALIGVSELKPSFVAATGNLSQIYVTYWGSGNGVLPENVNSLVGCFLPKSKSEQKSNLAVWDKDGTPHAAGAADCISGGGATACYWCTK
ncbi:MAG TPA: type II secretion system protein [Patescibacteria group bacterium]|jgi:prepilin-type N-terminal cleavage/methylation domain-containing protein|nr:type II secretion system protein [Patescibacteria group bacterium]